MNEFDDQQDPATNPNATMDFSADDGFASFSEGGGGRKIDKGMLILIAVVAVAIGGLYSMRTLSRTFANVALSDWTEIDAHLDDKVEPVEEAQKEAAARAKLDALLRQVAAPADLLADSDRDPFVAWREAKEEVAAPIVQDDPEAGPTREQLLEEWRASLQEVCEILTVKSIMGGGTPRALVNVEGALLQVGDTFDIDGTDISFTIGETGSRWVRLNAWNVELDGGFTAKVSMPE